MNTIGNDWKKGTHLKISIGMKAKTDKDVAFFFDWKKGTHLKISIGMKAKTDKDVAFFFIGALRWRWMSMM
jgi:hypothetical protein